MLHRDSSSQEQGQAGLSDGVQHPGRWSWDLAWAGIGTSPEVADFSGHTKMFFFTNKHVFLTNVDLTRRGQPPKLGLQVAGGHRKSFFLTKIKVLFDQYHQQMMPIPAELDMQVPGRLL